MINAPQIYSSYPQRATRDTLVAPAANEEPFCPSHSQSHRIQDDLPCRKAVPASCPVPSRRLTVKRTHSARFSSEEHQYMLRVAGWFAKERPSGPISLMYEYLAQQVGNFRQESDTHNSAEFIHFYRLPAAHIMPGRIM